MLAAFLVCDLRLLFALPICSLAFVLLATTVTELFPHFL